MAPHAKPCENGLSIVRAAPTRRMKRPGDHTGALLHELARVGEIQRSLLPAVLPTIPGFDLAAHYQPCARAGGDYFDIVPLVDGRWGFIMADVAGHGVSAAVIMAVMRALVHANLHHTRTMPARVFLEFMNRQMCGVYTRDGRFVTVWCAILDPETRSLTYASAGHPPTRLMRGGRISELDAVGGMPIGIDPLALYDEHTAMLEPDDVLILYTDGIAEARGRDTTGRAQFGADRLDRVLLGSSGHTASGCIERVVAAVEAFSGPCDPADDQTLLIVRVDARRACAQP